MSVGEVGYYTLTISIRDKPVVVGGVDFGLEGSNGEGEVIVLKREAVDFGSEGGIGYVVAIGETGSFDVVDKDSDLS